MPLFSASRLKQELTDGSRPVSRGGRSPSVAQDKDDFQTGGAAGSKDAMAAASRFTTQETPQPESSIWMQTIDFLLEAKAMQFAERTLAHDLLDPLGGPSSRYYICLATLKLQRQLMEEAEEALKEALQFEHQACQVFFLLSNLHTFNVLFSLLIAP